MARRIAGTSCGGESFVSAVWCRVAALMVEAYSGPQVRMLSSAPHWAREYTGGMAMAACAVSVIAGAWIALSAGLVPGSMRSSWTSVGWAPDRGTSSASTPVLGPVQSGDVPPRCSRCPESAPSFWSASSMLTGVQSRQAPEASCTRTWTTVSVTAGSLAQVTPTRENGSTPVLRTVSVGAVSGTPDTGSVVPSWTSAAGAGSATDPMSTSSEDVFTGSGSGAGAA